MRATVGVSALFALIAALTVFGGPLIESDRGRVLSELYSSRKLFLDSINGLSAAQWTYKAGPDRWSIAEISEHIVAAEGFIGAVAKESVTKSQADTAKAEQRAADDAKMDEALLAALRDRTKKVIAPAQMTPKGIYKTPHEAAEAFNRAREKTIEYVLNTEDDLRDHFSYELTGSELDGVQGLLLVAGHTERHVEQIDEVKQSAEYPKK
jgi:hypothetical protein